MDPIPRLSCERCKRRKIRCDKRSPCSACVSLGSKCDVVQRARLPRGRSAKVKKTALEERVARLESLLKQAPLSNNGEQRPVDDLAGPIAPNQVSSRISEFLAPEFWTTLSVEVTGLRETLDESEDEKDSLISPSPESASARSADKAILFGLGPASRHSNGSIKYQVPSERVRGILLQLYRERVDCVYKALHWPTVLAEIHRLHDGELDNCKLVPHKALESSIYFMALCSVTDEEANGLGLGHRTTLIEQYREVTEQAISQLGLLEQPTVTALQAFVVYLLGLRTFYSSATAWTLLAIAVRVGTALRLGQEAPHVRNQLELQIRRRLWYCIALIDTHASFDRGTLPMIRWEELGPPPLFVPDEDMSSVMIQKVTSPKFNEMSFFALMVQAMVTNKRILSMPDVAGEGCAAKLQEVKAFERYIEKKHSHVDPDAAPLEKFAQQAARGILAGMHLAIRRPPYMQHARLVPPTDDFDILEHATYVLQQDLEKKSPEYAPWAWKSWVQWHALAIILAELCSRPPTEDHEVSYSVAVESFDRYSSLIADSEKGMLWRPIAKLMRRLQQLRANRVATFLPKAGVLPFNGCSYSAEQRCGSAGVPSTADSTVLANPDLYVDNSPNWFTDFGSSFIPGEDIDRVTYDNAQFNWSTFMDYVNMDGATDFSNGIF